MAGSKAVKLSYCIQVDGDVATMYIKLSHKDVARTET
jgi:hypothetical protein